MTKTFLLVAEDHRDQAEARARYRADHIAYLKAPPPNVEIALAGPIRESTAGNTGTFALVKADSRAAALAFAQADPFAVRGVFARIDLHEVDVTLGTGTKT